jgi:hypothetical protein
MLTELSDCLRSFQGGKTLHESISKTGNKGFQPCAANAYGVLEPLKVPLISKNSRACSGVTTAL